MTPKADPEPSAMPQVAAVCLKLPPFSPKQVRVLYHTVEAQFNLSRKITDDQAKFDHMLTALEAEIQERVAHFFDELPPVGTRYEEFKGRLIDSFNVSRHQRPTDVVKETIGKDTPSD